MKDYIDKGTLEAQKPGFIYLDRKTSHSSSRAGLMIALDLEHYDYNIGSQTLIRATEGTVLERIPPRVKIRENAILELPHIMVLIDDIGKTVIEPLTSKLDEFKMVYNTDLMMNGGHVKGFKIEDKKTINEIVNALEKLADRSAFEAKYGIGKDKGTLLFAVGDGNHSLATAKACWEKIKKTLPVEQLNHHPARYALVELVNLHDKGLTFEPIHRVLFNINPEVMLDKMITYFKEEGSKANYQYFDKKPQIRDFISKLNKKGNNHVISFIFKCRFGVFTVEEPKRTLDVATLQEFLDKYMVENPSIRIDYIHGEDVVTELGSQEGNIGFYLSPMNKNALFKTVILDGVLPRKTFSMGEAEEKRFYLECRKII